MLHWQLVTDSCHGPFSLRACHLTPHHGIVALSFKEGVRFPLVLMELQFWAWWKQAQCQDPLYSPPILTLHIILWLWNNKCDVFFLAAISEPVISANRRCGRENRNHHQGKLFIFYEESFVLCRVACKDPEVCWFFFLTAVEIMYSVAGLVFWQRSELSLVGLMLCSSKVKPFWSKVNHFPNLPCCHNPFMIIRLT